MEELDMKLCLACRACKTPVAGNTTSSTPFLLSGYDDVVEWSDIVEGVPDLADPFWQRAENLPAVGESRLVKVHHPFCQSSKETFWSLYLPALSSLNGWSDYPEEIDRSGFVECRLTDIIASTPHEAWARVTVSEVILFRDACTVFPADAGNPEFINNLADFSCRWVTACGNWLLFEVNSEGDFGRRALVNNVGGHYHLVLFVDWGVHESTAYMGNLLLSRECVEKLVEIFQNG